MDPIAALRELRELAAKDWTGKDTDELTAEEMDQIHTDHCRMADLFQGLDGWMSKGGFSPWK